MTDEWVQKRVADLEVGDEVRDYAPLTDARDLGNGAVSVGWNGGSGAGCWPAHAIVDVRRPAEVTVSVPLPEHEQLWCVVNIGTLAVASFRQGNLADEYADRLRGSADERAKALGQ